MKNSKELAESSKKLMKLLGDEGLSYGEIAMVLGLTYAIIVATEIKEVEHKP